MLRFTSPRFTSPPFTSPCFTSPRFTSRRFTSPCFTSPRFTSLVQSSPLKNTVCRRREPCKDATFFMYYFKNECEGFITISKHEKTDESFYCFRVFGNRDETRCTSF